MRSHSQQRILGLLLGFIGVLVNGLEATGEELSLAISKSVRLDLEGVSKGLKESESKFVPWPAARLEERREQLDTALEELDALLQRSGEDREEGWKKYLRWDAVQSQLEADKPDLRKLQPSLAQFYRNQLSGLHRQVDNREVTLPTQGKPNFCQYWQLGAFQFPVWDERGIQKQFHPRPLFPHARVLPNRYDGDYRVINQNQSGRYR